jgi:peptidyl-tRNA hydrolase
MNRKLKSDVKLVILVRKDLSMSPGKFAVQVSHATAKAMMGASNEIVDKWNKDCIKTIVLEAPDSYTLVDLDYKLDTTSLSKFLVIDLGVTEFGAPEITSMGILGDSHIIDMYTQDYKLYKPNTKFLEENYGLEDGTVVQDVMKHVEKNRKESTGKEKKGGW